MRQIEILIKKDSVAPLNNHVDECIGTGRMGLALHAEYQEQLKLVQKEIGFQYIRGHGLFSDDMAIYQEYTDASGVKRAEYNFTYLDRVMDFYLSVGLKPFLELGFMPEKLASGTQTIFYWKGNVTPPNAMDGWTALVTATLRHLMQRYGREEVLLWPIEVWNEPNLPGFWKDADMAAYFALFAATFRAVKALDGELKVGGPAICGVDDVRWMKEFLDFCVKEGITPDFITRHHYTSKTPAYDGHYAYIELADPDEGFGFLHTTRQQVDAVEAFKGLPIHITEFNTSYTPIAPVHDTNRNAAFIAYLLSKLGDDNASYSYWTFGDVFEEMGVPFTPFHGGFGLLANGSIKKPTFYAFQYFKRLKAGQQCVYRGENAVWMRCKNGAYRGVLWNKAMADEGEKMGCTITLPMEAAACGVVTERVDEECCNPLKVWHDIGEPANLNDAQLALLRTAAEPLVQTQRIVPENGSVKVQVELAPNALVYVEILPLENTPDRGYDYARVCACKG